MNVLEARRRLLGAGVYKKTVEGNPAIAQGSLSRRYPGITMQGWTEQAQYEGKNLLPVDVGEEFDGVAVTDSATFEEDGVHAVYKSIVSGEARDIYMYGNNNNSVESGYVEIPSLTPGDYRLVNDNIGISLYVVVWRNGASVVLGFANNATTKITIQDGDKFRIFLRCNITGDTDVKIHPMIVKEGEDTTTYEPYTGGQPSPNPDYPQEIVSAGNYDEGTGKYQYEINVSDAEENPTKSQTVTLTSDRPLTKWDKLEKRNGQWGWVYKSAEIESYTDESVPGEYYSTTGQVSVGAQVWYETATETFVPLSAEEQEQMNALHTNRPTTVLSNDCDCNMTLTYKTKKSLEVTT